MKVCSLKYLSVRDRDQEWGITVNTVGTQHIDPHASYPPEAHPNLYNFKPQSGRILNEYQMVYITRGEGYFCSNSSGMQRVKAGTIILLFPGEWHSYYPDREIGWEEYWVGFSGLHIDRRLESGFFDKTNPIYNIGINTSIVDMYNEILDYATDERIGYQQMISSIVLHMLGLIYFNRSNNVVYSDVVSKIDEARHIMKSNIEQPISPEDIADRLGLGYSWFRRMFKRYTGVSPLQYQTQQRLLMAKELLTSTELRVNEIAYRLNFENGSQFATFFKKLEQITPSDYREKTQKSYSINE